ncbi:hypothetical protein ACFRBN_36500, partial [Streptomyces sp. NPDC056627]
GRENAVPVSARTFAARVRESVGLPEHRAARSDRYGYYPGIRLLPAHEQEPGPVPSRTAAP